MAKKVPQTKKAAQACVSREIRKHWKKSKPAGQVVAIAFSVCARKGYRVPKKPKASKADLGWMKGNNPGAPIKYDPSWAGLGKPDCC
jgi:hypothetical protein